MSANNKELIEKWNRFFQCKIRETDLLKPTEEFLVNVLESYIANINIDIHKMKDVNCLMASKDRNVNVSFKTDITLFR